MSKPMRADFIAALNAANATGNMIPVCKSWLKGFDLSPNILQKLSKTGLTRSFFLPSNDRRIKDLRLIYSGGLRPPEAEAEAETDKKGKLSPFTSGGGDPSDSTNKSAKKVFDKRIADLPQSLNGIGRGRRDMVNVVTRSDERLNCKNPRHKDPRSFDKLKKAILPIAKKFDTLDPDKILRIGKQSLKISPKQCAVAVQQLIEDGEL